MTADLAERVADLATWLPLAAELITEPDQDGTTTPIGGQVVSSPPWNPAVAFALLDIAEGARRLEASLRQVVTGHTGQRRGGSDGNTTAALDAIVQLGHAVTVTDARTAARIVARWVTMIERLPAIDEQPVWDKLTGAPCPFCGTRNLYAARRSGDVVCGYPDHPGYVNAPPRGRLEVGHFGPTLVWNDGTTQTSDL